MTTSQLHVFVKQALSARLLRQLPFLACSVHFPVCKRQRRQWRQWQDCWPGDHQAHVCCYQGMPAFRPQRHMRACFGLPLSSPHPLTAAPFFEHGTQPPASYCQHPLFKVQLQFTFHQTLCFCRARAASTLVRRASRHDEKISNATSYSKESSNMPALFVKCFTLQEHLRAGDCLLQG